jgi:hypothetical protein
VSAARAPRGWQRVEIATLKSQAVHAGFAYWDGLRQGRLFPARSDVSPRGAGNLLRHVVVLAVIAEPPDFLFRIVGDEVEGAYNLALSNKRLSEVGAARPATGEALREILEGVCADGQPFACRNWLRTQTTGETFATREAIFLPLGERAPAVDHVLVVDAPA